MKDLKQCTFSLSIMLIHRNTILEILIMTKSLKNDQGKGKSL